MLITIKISEVLEALAKGQTWTKKEDLGFGSIEKSFGLTSGDLTKLKNHPKLAGVETNVPTLFIIDDTEEVGTQQPKPATGDTVVSEVKETKLEVREVVYKAPPAPVEEVQYEAFI